MNNANGHDTPQIIRAPLIAPPPKETNAEMFTNVVLNVRKAIGANGGQVPMVDPMTIIGQSLIIERLDALLIVAERLLDAATPKTMALPDFLAPKQE